MASVIDRGDRGSHSANISQRMEGYIVSHRLYRSFNYRNNINAALVLEILPTNTSFYIRLLDYNVGASSFSTVCDDCLYIAGDTSLKVCGSNYTSLRTWTEVKVQDNKIRFNFTSDRRNSGRGFMIHYKGKLNKRCTQ